MLPSLPERTDPDGPGVPATPDLVPEPGVPASPPPGPRMIGDIAYSLMEEARYQEDGFWIRVRRWSDPATDYEWDTFENLGSIKRDVARRVRDTWDAVETVRRDTELAPPPPDVVEPAFAYWKPFVERTIAEADDRFEPDSPAWTEYTYNHYKQAWDSTVSIGTTAQASEPHVQTAPPLPVQPEAAPDQPETPSAPANAVAFEIPDQMAHGEYRPDQLGWKFATCGLVSVAALSSWAPEPDGHVVTVSEAIDAARQHGWWDPNLGMHGPKATADMLEHYGIPVEMHTGLNESRTAIIDAVESGRPVVISTRAHYFVLAPRSYDPDTQTFNVGASGLVARNAGGAARMSLEAMDAASRRMAGFGFQAALVPTIAGPASVALARSGQLASDTAATVRGD